VALEDVIQTSTKCNAFTSCLVRKGKIPSVGVQVRHKAFVQRRNLHSGSPLQQPQLDLGPGSQSRHISRDNCLGLDTTWEPHQHTHHENRSGHESMRYMSKHISTLSGKLANESFTPTRYVD
jgi:hypothetical protein